jgi:hypothetical protein
MTIAPSSYRRRLKRGSSVEVPHGFWGTLLENVSRSEVLLRLALCLGAALVLLMLMHGWSEPFPFRAGMVSPRGVVARVPFEKPDAERTRTAQERAAAQVRVVYSQDKAPIVRLRDGLKNRLAEIAAAESVTASSRAAWLEFAPEAAPVIDALVAAGEKPAVREPPLAPEPPAGGSPPIPPSPPDSPTPADAAADAGPSDVEKKPVAESGVADAKPAEQPDKRVQEAGQSFQRFRARIDTK